MTNPNKDGVPEGAIEAAADAIWFNLCGDIRQSKIDKLVYREAAEAALAAALPFLVQPQAGIGVKGLVWGTIRTTEDGLEAQDALCSIGHYIAASNGWFLVGQTNFNSAHNLVEAKIAADADYAARINSALSQPLPSPQGETASLRGLLEEAREWVELGPELPGLNTEDAYEARDLLSRINSALRSEHHQEEKST